MIPPDVAGIGIAETIGDLGALFEVLDGPGRQCRCSRVRGTGNPVPATPTGTRLGRDPDELTGVP
jgi:hypothetical protein